MDNNTIKKSVLYLIAFVAANLCVVYFGPVGLIFTSLFLIPFDFVMRCMFHEQWKGLELIAKLGALVVVAALITYAINSSAQNIALASVGGFVAAQIGAGVFYQAFIKQPFFIKVNGSDLIGIVIDSMLFQYIAFNSIEWSITGGQTALKFVGGLFWYWLIFYKLQLQEKWK